MLKVFWAQETSKQKVQESAVVLFCIFLEIKWKVHYKKKWMQPSV